MEMAEYEEGVPSWVDLGTTDVPGARAFYGALFGWDTPEGPPEAGGYTVATLGGRTVAGIGPRMNPEAPAAWTTYVNTADADAVAARVAAAGGTVLAGPFDVLDAGRMAVVADPAWAVIGVWQPAGHRGAGLVNEPDTWCWSELLTTDVAGAKAFYAEVFGWGATDQGEGAGYTEWQVSGRPVGGMMAMPDEMGPGVPPHWGVYFAVADADAAAARVAELGGRVLREPADIEPGRFAVVADPGGVPFNVLALKAELAG
jgi:predicted enzyme related to lactoylglutathione lyase